jgi:hypothetical protein
MSIKMIDTAICEHVMSQLVPGEHAVFLTGPEHKPHSFKVIELKDFSVIVESVLAKNAENGITFTQKLEISIAKSELYQKEVNAMHMQIPQEQPKPPRPRGRPPKNDTAAKPETMPTTQEAQPWQTATQPHPLMEGVRVMTEEQPASTVEFEGEWIEKALEEACNNFKADLLEIVKAVYVELPTPEQPAAPVTYTCFVCMFCNVKENRCDKFNLVPPMFVMADAKNQCPDYINSDEIPF